MGALLNKLYRKYFYDIKLKYKLIFSHLILVMVPTITLALFFYGKFYDIVVNDTIRSEQALAEQTASALEVTVSKVISSSASISNSAFILDLFHTMPEDITQELLSEDILKPFYISALNQIDHQLIDNIRIYVSEPYDFLCDYNIAQKQLFYPLESVYGTYWYGIFDSQRPISLFCPGLYLSPEEERSCGQLAYIHQIPSVADPARPGAYVAVYFSGDEIGSILKQGTNVADSAAYLINERDSVVSTSDAKLSGAYLLSRDSLSSLMEPGEFILHPFIDQNAYVGYYPINNTDWTMISVMPERSLTSKGNELIFQFIGLYLLFVALAFLTALFLSTSIVRRLSTVVKQMGTVRFGKPKRLEQTSGKDEIGNLITTYNYMTDELNLLMARESQAAEELRLSEFRALQAQINPHFLYNSLDMINWLSKSDQKEEVSRAIQSLSKFYKLTLSKGDTIVSVEKELEHVNLYVALQNMRYNHQIHYLEDVPGDLYDYKIPKLTLQPLVENSIQHGILERESKQGDIVVTGWREPGLIVIAVMDNGNGIPPEELEHILDGVKKPSAGSNLGVVNTHRRIQLLFGKEYGLYYTSTAGAGTEVQIRLPASPPDTGSEDSADVVT